MRFWLELCYLRLYSPDCFFIRNRRLTDRKTKQSSRKRKWKTVVLLRKEKEGGKQIKEKEKEIGNEEKESRKEEGQEGEILEMMKEETVPGMELSGFPKEVFNLLRKRCQRTVWTGKAVDNGERIF